MSKNLALKATKRTEKAKDVRTRGFIPSIIYGKGQENINLEVEYHDFRRAFEKGGFNTIIDLDIDGKKVPVLVHDVDFHPLKDTFTHVDFHAINMDEEIHASVPVVTTGTSRAVKDLGGILVHGKEEIEIKCLPKDLIHEILVDISIIEDFSTTITVGDLNVPEGIKVLENDETLVLTVNAPKAVEETTSEKVTPAEGEGAEEEKKAE